MGDNFLKQQVRNFKKGRDKALDSLSKPTLFIAPEALGKTFPVIGRQVIRSVTSLEVAT